MYLLRMHTDRKGKHPGQPEYELVPCLDLRTEARDVLRFEAERLAAKPPPPPPVASPAAPMDTGDATPPQAAAAVHKRPCGSAPTGEEWDEGKGEWVKRPRGGGPQPVNDLILKVRPMGSVPKGERWDATAGCWVSAKGGCCKRKAAAKPPSNENAAPQQAAEA